MKKVKLLSFATICSIAFTANVFADGSSKSMYLNRDLGFNVEGYKYNQKALPCEVDKHLISDIVKRSEEQDIKVKTVGTGDTIAKTTDPILSIEINTLSLGKDGFNFGKKSDSVLPSMKVTVGLIRDKALGGTVLAKHSCAIMTIADVVPTASSVLDMGSYGVSVCDATKKCLKDLSKDIVQWVAPQL